MKTIMENENQEHANDSIGTPSPALQQFTVGERVYGFVEGPENYIVTDTDFCHRVRPFDRPELELITGGRTDADGFYQHTSHRVTLQEIRQLAEPIPSFERWAHYWGIKSRVHDNYTVLLGSMAAIGADVSGMPKWGMEPVTSEQRG